MTEESLFGLKSALKGIVKEVLLEILQEQKIKVNIDDFDEIVDEKTLAILAASADAILGKRVRIKKVQFLDSNKSLANWSVTGRASIMNSHNVNVTGNISEPSYGFSHR